MSRIHHPGPGPVLNLHQEGAPGPSRPRPWARWLVMWGATIGLFVLLFSRIDLRQFTAALRLADWRLVALAAACALVIGVLACTLRLRAIVSPLPAPEGRPSLRELGSIYVASCAAQNLLPTGAAEVLRTMQLHRLHGYAISSLVAALVLEKVIEALGLGLETLAVALLGPLPRALGYTLYTFAFVGAGGAALLFLVAWRVQARGGEVPAADPAGARGLRGLLGRGRAFIGRLALAIHQLHAPRTWLLGLLYTVLADCGTALTVGLCLGAVGIHLHVSAWFVVVLAARLAGVLPATPGQFGVLEAAVVLALSALSVPRAPALAVAILYHGIHFVPGTLLGLSELRRQWR